MLPTMPMTPSSCRRAAGSDSGGGVGGGAVITPGGKVLRGDEVAAEASPWQAETLGRKGDAFFKQHDNGAGGGSATTSELARTPCSDELQGDRVDGGKGRGCCTTHPPFLLPAAKGHPLSRNPTCQAKGQRNLTLSPRQRRCGPAALSLRLSHSRAGKLKARQDALNLSEVAAAAAAAAAARKATAAGSGGRSRDAASTPGIGSGATSELADQLRRRQSSLQVRPSRHERLSSRVCGLPASNDTEFEA